jgi:hypothetical protein
VCVCVCVCVRERARERESESEREKELLWCGDGTRIGQPTFCLSIGLTTNLATKNTTVRNCASWLSRSSEAAHL